MSATPKLLDALLKAIAAEDGLWVPLEAYLSEYHETREAVYTRRAKGLWADGVESKRIHGAGVWINVPAARAWVEQQDDGPTELYRHFASDGTLLYIGISKREPARRAQHRATSRWFPQVHRTEVEQHPTRTAALQAELDAIRTERPRFNVMGRVR